MTRDYLLCIAILVSPSACISVKAPPLIDRHTVMESDAAGEWPELEDRFFDKSLHSGPIPLPREDDGSGKRRVYSYLGSDLSRAEATAPPKEEPKTSKKSAQKPNKK